MIHTSPNCTLIPYHPNQLSHLNNELDPDLFVLLLLFINHLVKGVQVGSGCLKVEVGDDVLQCVVVVMSFVVFKNF